MNSTHNTKLGLGAIFLLGALVAFLPVVTWGDSSARGEESVWGKQSASNLYPLVRVEQKNSQVHFTFLNPDNSRKEVRSLARKLLTEVEEVVAGNFDPKTNRMVVFVFISKVSTLQMLTTTFSKGRKQQKIASFQIGAPNPTVTSSTLVVYQRFESTKEGRRFVAQRGVFGWWPRRGKRNCPGPIACLPTPPPAPSPKPSTPPTQPEVSPVPAPPAPLPPLLPGEPCLNPCALKENPGRPNELIKICCGRTEACINRECIRQDECSQCDRDLHVCEKNPETNKFECKCAIPDDGTNLCTASESSPICPKLHPAHEPQCLREAREGCVTYSCSDRLASNGCTTDSLDYCYTGYVFDPNNTRPVCCAPMEACVADPRGEPFAFQGRSCQRQLGCLGCSGHQRCERNGTNPDTYGCRCNYTTDPCADGSRCGDQPCHSRQDYNGCYDYKCGAWSEAAPPPTDPLPTTNAG